VIHLVFIFLGLPRVRALAAAALLATLATSAAGEPSPDPAPETEPCSPLHPEPSALPDLQQGAHALCRALLGEREPGPLAERLRLRIGGWADGSYQDTDHRSDEYTFTLDHTNLFADARLDDRWQLFFEGEWEHEADLEGRRDEREWEVEQLYGDVRFTDALRLRIGRFSTPVGHWTPIHWSILVDTIEPPIHERNRLVPEQQNGGRLHGVIFADDWLGLESEFEYSLFGGYAEEGFDAGNADGLTLGSDAALRLAGDYRVGASLYTQENGDEDHRRETSTMLYGEARLPFHLFARAEYLRQRRDARTRTGLLRDIDVVYAKLRWDFRDDAYLNYRFEFGEDDRYGITVDHTVHRVTLGVRPIPRIRLKAEWARHVYASPRIENYHFWGASAGIFF
jgi:hypothetical protein